MLEGTPGYLAAREAKNVFPGGREVLQLGYFISKKVVGATV
jgi:hypothetical protein